MPPGTLRVPEADAERPLRRYHAERGNDHNNDSRYWLFKTNLPANGISAASLASYLENLADRN